MSSVAYSVSSSACSSSPNSCLRPCGGEGHGVPAVSGSLRGGVRAGDSSSLSVAYCSGGPESAWGSPPSSSAPGAAAQASPCAAGSVFGRLLSSWKADGGGSWVDTWLSPRDECWYVRVSMFGCVCKTIGFSCHLFGAAGAQRLATDLARCWRTDFAAGEVGNVFEELDNIPALVSQIGNMNEQRLHALAAAASTAALSAQANGILKGDGHAKPQIVPTQHAGADRLLLHLDDHADLDTQPPPAEEHLHNLNQLQADCDDLQEWDATHAATTQEEPDGRTQGQKQRRYATCLDRRRVSFNVHQNERMSSSGKRYEVYAVLKYGPDKKLKAVRAEKFAAEELGDSTARAAAATLHASWKRSQAARDFLSVFSVEVLEQACAAMKAINLTAATGRRRPSRGARAAPLGKRMLLDASGDPASKAAKIEPQKTAARARQETFQRREPSRDFQLTHNDDDPHSKDKHQSANSRQSPASKEDAPLDSHTKILLGCQHPYERRSASGDAANASKPNRNRDTPTVPWDVVESHNIRTPGVWYDGSRAKWFAMYRVKDGPRFQREFTTNKHGYLAARQQALECRRQWEVLALRGKFGSRAAALATKLRYHENPIHKLLPGEVAVHPETQDGEAVSSDSTRGQPGIILSPEQKHGQFEDEAEGGHPNTPFGQSLDHQELLEPNARRSPREPRARQHQQQQQHPEQRQQPRQQQQQQQQQEEEDEEAELLDEEHHQRSGRRLSSHGHFPPDEDQNSPLSPAVHAMKSSKFSRHREELRPRQMRVKRSSASRPVDVP
eukprot:GHVT01010752.1.p1 GENE.GHVT01010752.1~~GHVT01010752.1.p1  ORF type:complete len:851 (-),score=255.28 GHVT01010752.1:1804-4158(-)